MKTSRRLTVHNIYMAAWCTFNWNDDVASFVVVSSRLFPCLQVSNIISQQNTNNKKE